MLVVGRTYHESFGKGDRPPKPAALPDVSEAFAEQVREARRIWLEENMALGEGSDCLTPFDHFLYYPVREEAAQPQVPESRNIRAVEMHGDQSVLVSFPSCRSASAFAGWLSAAKEES